MNPLTATNVLAKLSSFHKGWLSKFANGAVGRTLGYYS